MQRDSKQTMVSLFERSVHLQRAKEERSKKVQAAEFKKGRCLLLNTAGCLNFIMVAHNGF